MHHAARAFAALGLCAALALAAAPARAQMEPNFKPLERGDYTEVEQRLQVSKALQVGADYAFRIRATQDSELPPAQQGTDTSHDLRLKLDTLFNEDVQVHLTLEIGQQAFSGSQLRHADTQANGRLSDGLSTSIGAREAYLRYNFNPRSGLIFGKQELSLGDRRGKVFDALVAGVTFDCQVGTWCMPFGYGVLGPRNRDAVVHWALQYNAWDSTQNGVRNALQVEVFRFRYDESNVPLGVNLGPARFNPDDPFNTAGTSADPSQQLNAGAGTEPVYYDAHNQNFYGLRVMWLGDFLFANMDATAYRGERKYHLFPLDTTGLPGGSLALTGQVVTPRDVKGSVVEAELGWRWSGGRVGARYMSASGDRYEPSSNGQDYNRDLNGFFEITPGTYTGARLWFNGGNSRIDDGAGLGHSVNNTRLAGLFLDIGDPVAGKVAYSTGVYDLALNNPIPDSNNVLRRKIGLEWDNMVTWHPHKVLKFQFEVNGIVAGGALRVNDYTAPPAGQTSLYQVIGRVVYGF